MDTVEGFLRKERYKKRETLKILKKRRRKLKLKPFGPFFFLHLERYRYKCLCPPSTWSLDILDKRRFPYSITIVSQSDHAWSQVPSCYIHTRYHIRVCGKERKHRDKKERVSSGVPLPMHAYIFRYVYIRGVYQANVSRLNCAKN